MMGGGGGRGRHIITILDNLHQHENETSKSVITLIMLLISKLN